MKKLLSLILVVVLCLGALVACDFGSFFGPDDDTEAFDRASTYLYNLYSVSEDKQTTTTDFDVVAMVKIDGVTYDVTWKCDKTAITIKESSKGGYYTVDLPASNDSQFTYTLTATIKSAAGATKSYDFTRILPVLKENTNVAVGPVVGTAYNLGYAHGDKQNTVYFVTGYPSGYYLDTTETEADAVNVYVEEANGGKYLYMMFYGVKKYVNFVTRNNYVNVSLDDTAKTVYTYDETLKTFVSNIASADYAIGTKTNNKNDKGEYYTTVGPLVTNTSAYFLEFYPSKHEDHPSLGLDTPEKIVNAAYDLADDTSLKGMYTLTGVITKIDDEYSSSYGNVTVTMVVGDMTDKPIKCYRMKGTGADVIKVGDTITVYGVIKNFKGTVEFDTGCQLLSYEEGTGEVPGGGDDTPSDKVAVVVDTPVVGTAYKFGFASESLNKTLFLSGIMDGFYYGTVANVDNAVDVVLEDAGDGKYYVSFGEGASKKYLSVVYALGSDNKYHINVEFAATGCAFTYDATLKTLVGSVDIDGTATPVYLGSPSNKNYETMSASKDATTMFIAHFYAVEEGHVHALASVAAKNATCTEDGNIAYWYCDSCDQYFSDADATTAISLADTVIKAAHNYVDGTCSVCGEAEPVEDEVGNGFYVSVVNKAGTIYFNGSVSSNRFDATTDKSAAKLVHIVRAANDGEYVLYFMDGDVKTYLVINDKSDGAATTTDVEGASVFYWNDTYNTFAVVDSSNNRALGVDPTKEFLNYKCYDIGSGGATYNWAVYADVNGNAPDFSAGGTTPPAGGDDEDCEHNYVDGICTECGEADPDYVAEMTIAEALAAENGTKVVVSGTVSFVRDAWNADFTNMTVYITDGTDYILLYRLGTEVALGDTVTVTGNIKTYNNVNQIDQGATAEITANGAEVTFPEYTFDEVASLKDGANITVAGTVSEIVSAWSDKYGNMDVNIVDADGNVLYAYRLRTNVAVGDYIVITGYKSSYNGELQIGEGSTAVVSNPPVPEVTLSGSYTGTNPYTGDVVVLAFDGLNVTFTASNYEATFAYSVADGVVTIYNANGEAWSSVFYAITLVDGAVSSFVYNGNTYTIPGADDEDDDEADNVYAPTESEGSFTVTTTDTYTFEVDLYGFKAPVAATYYFTIPAGLGVIVSGGRAPVVDYYDNENGYVWEMALDADEVVSFYIAATVKSDWTIEFTTEAGGDDPIVTVPSLVLGENTVTVTEADILYGAIEYTFTVETAATYTFASNDLMAVIYLDDINTPRGMAYLEEGTYKIMVVVYTNEAGDYTLTVTSDAEGGSTDECQHLYSYDFMNSVYPTCITDGCDKYVCDLCGYVLEEVIPASSEYCEWETDMDSYVAPTCQTSGYAFQTCAVCGEDRELTIEASDFYHNYVLDEDASVAPTCTEEGLEKNVCSVCGAVDERILDPEHSYEYSSNDSFVKCSICDDIYFAGLLTNADMPEYVISFYRYSGMPGVLNIYNPEDYTAFDEYFDYAIASVEDNVYTLVLTASGDDTLGLASRIVTVTVVESGITVDISAPGGTISFTNVMDAEPDTTLNGTYEFKPEEGASFVVKFENGMIYVLEDTLGLGLSESFAYSYNANTGMIFTDEGYFYVDVTTGDLYYGRGWLLSPVSEEGGEEPEEPTCEHTNVTTTTTSTCTVAGVWTKVCDDCGATIDSGDDVVANHVDVDGDFLCDYECGTVIEPEADSFLTIPQALALAEAMGNTYTTNKFFVTGIIVSVVNTTYGNLTIVDENGDSLYIYGLYTWDKAIRYDKMEYKPVKGDELTVYTVLGCYKGDPQGKDAWLDDVVAHECDYTDTVVDPGCTANGYTLHTCDICGASYKDSEVDALGHTTDNGTCDRCGSVVGGDFETVLPSDLTFSGAANKASADTYMATNYSDWTIGGKLGQTYAGYLGFGRSGDATSSLTSSTISVNSAFTVTAVLKGNGSGGVATSTLTFTLVDANGDVVAIGYADGATTAAITPADAKDTTYNISFTLEEGKAWTDVSNLKISFAKSTGNIGLKSLSFAQ